MLSLDRQWKGYDYNQIASGLTNRSFHNPYIFLSIEITQ